MEIRQMSKSWLYHLIVWSTQEKE